jgi:hypothetical protein
MSTAFPPGHIWRTGRQDRKGHPIGVQVAEDGLGNPLFQFVTLYETGSATTAHKPFTSIKEAREATDRLFPER